MMSKGNSFHTEVESDSAKDQVVPKKVKIFIGFLGFVDCSTNGDLLGEIRISFPPSC
jgi:hypothetical protein